MTNAQNTLDRNLVSLNAPSSFAAEQYQGLRLTVERLKRSRDVRVIAVTSPAAGDGKTVTSINLAGTLARGSDAPVLLIDADLRRPMIADRLGISDPAAAGLAEAIVGPMSLAAASQRLEAYNVDVVRAGTPASPVSQLLRSPRLELLLREAREKYEFIIIDTPPLLPVFDASLLSRWVDGLIVVVAANQTPRKLLAESLNLLDPAKVLGIVFNSDSHPMFGYYRGYYREYFPGSRMAQEA